jgi:NaMN:DMB phosphoribosyltransferase
MAAARASGEGEVAVWLAGVAGGERPRVRRVDVDRDEAVGAEQPVTVAEVAHAVDAGRDLAAAAAADGIGVLITSAPAAHDLVRAQSLLAALADDPAHPLRALRRLGTHEIAVLCGVALGAGEHGLGCVCDGLAALAGAVVAAGIEPALRPRLRAVGEDDHAGMLGIAVVDGNELAAALD